MFSKIILSRENLLYNLNQFRKITDKKICLMIKANAYGHGLEEVVNVLGDYVDYFGVANQNEAETARSISNTKIIVFGKCDDYIKCMQKNISYGLFSLKMAKNLTKIAKNKKLSPKFHLCINSGMNRYGVKSLREFVKIIRFLEKNNIELEGVYTHFSSLTTDENYTQKQLKKFEEFLAFLPPKWKSVVHVGGGNTIVKNINADMYRIGMGIYGYGYDFVKPVLKIKSQIVDIQDVEKGEHVGYLCSYTSDKNMKVATIPIGYADGVSRKLSNKIDVLINGQKAKSCGNICMDAFMVDVSNIKCKIGDEVVVLDDAKVWAKILETTEYETFTNFCKFRGIREIE